MVELWFYSGRIGNCMFAYAFNRCIADTLQLKCQLPKGTEILGFPLISEDAKSVNHHEEKYTLYDSYKENPKTIISDNDNMLWFLEPTFKSKKFESFDDFLTIDKVCSTPDIRNKWIVTLGNFEYGQQYLPFREKLKNWFQFPEIDYNKFEFFNIAENKNDYYNHCEKKLLHNEITKEDLCISLRLEDYTIQEHIDRLLDYDYFSIILEKINFKRLIIITNPGSIGHNDQYKHIRKFHKYNPILVRCYDPVQSLAYLSKFNNIAISQSTYSWWGAFLSSAENIYFPIPKEGPFADNHIKYRGIDMRVSSPEYKYVDYLNRQIMPDDYYKKIDFINKKWKN